MKIKKVYADALTTLAKGTDAGIYRLNPKRVEIVSCEQDVKRVLAECEKTGKSVSWGDLFIRPDYFRFCIDGNQS